MNELQKLCDNLLASYIKDADKVPEGFFTLKQIAKGMNKSIPTANRMVQSELSSGRMETAKFKIDTTRGIYPVTHYRYVRSK